MKQRAARTKDGVRHLVCCCRDLKILLWSVLKRATFPETLQPVSKQVRIRTGHFQLQLSDPICRAWPALGKGLGNRSSKLLSGVEYWKKHKDVTAVWWTVADNFRAASLFTSLTPHDMAPRAVGHSCETAAQSAFHW